MKKMIKSLIAAIGVALMMIGSAFAADAAKIGDTPYATLGEAMSAVRSGDTITLLSDVVGSDTLFLEFNGKTDITLTALTDVVVNGNIQVGFHPSHIDGVNRSESTFTVKGLTVKGTLTVLSADANLVVDDNKAAQITVKTYSEGINIAISGNEVDGILGAASNKYGMFLVPNATAYNLKVEGNTFKNVNSHAFVVQGSGDGTAVTAANSITLTANNFESWGLGGSANRAAFKIWADTKYAPSSSTLPETTVAMRELVKSIASEESGNKFLSTADNTVQFDAYGAAGDAADFPEPVTYVAQVGETKFNSIADAVAAVKESGGTLMLLNNCSESMTFSNPTEGALIDITVDLNGFTVTSAESTLWVSDGYVVTVKDSSDVKTGKIISTSAEGEAVAIARGGKVILDGGTVENVKYSVYIYSKNATGTEEFVMNGGIVTVPNGGNAITIASGKATINGGKVLCNKTPITGGGWNTYVYPNGTLVITGGEFLGTIGNYGKTVISGGTYSYPDDPNDGFREEHLALGYATRVNADGSITVYELPTSLQGTGTTEDPFLINNIDDLKLFRRLANTYTQDGSNQFRGKYVKLMVDLDLAGENWEPIGKNSNGDHQNFLGYFDGNDKTISNLTIIGADHLGFFANVGDGGDGVPASVKNLNFHNVKISGTGSYVGTVIANGHATTIVDNVHVTGTIDISGKGYVGGLVGHAYIKMNDVSLIGSGIIKSSFWCCGGILGYAGEGSTVITNAHVEGVTITSAAGALGAIVGRAEDNNGTQPISGVNLSAKNVEIKTYTGDYGDSYSNNGIGYLYGGTATSNLSGNLFVDNVTLATSNGVNPTAVDAVASIGDSVYFSLSSAIFALKDGDSLTIYAGEISEGTIKFPAALKNVTIKGETGAILKDMTLMASDGSNIAYEGITFDGIVFDNANILFSGQRASASYKDWTIANCEFKNVARGSAAVSFNLNTSEAMENFTFTNNVIDGVTGGNYSGLVLRASKGSVVISGNDIKNVVWNAVQLLNSTADTLTITDNKFASGADEGILNLYGVTATTLTIKENQFLVAENQPGVCYIESADVSLNYWGGEAPANLPEGVIYTNYYTIYDAETGALGGLTEVKIAVAKIGEVEYYSIADALAAAKAGDEIELLADVNDNLNLSANVILVGNGKQITGTLYLMGDVTLKGHVKANAFDFENVGTEINIPAGATFEITGTGRMIIGHGCTFNIEGTITDGAAKTADKATLTPSLVMPGASFTGAGVTFNVKNAYITAPSSYCSSSKSASGTFDFNIENSIIETAGKLAFEAQSTAATVNFELKDSVLNTGSHLVFGVAAGEVVIDNSNVNVGTSRQLENRSTMTIKNGSVVNGTVATSSNAINPGTIIVENATYAVTGQFSGSTVGTGTLVIKNGANVSVGSIVDKANIQIDATGMTVGDEINLTANLSKFAGTVEVINNDKLNASIVDGKIVLSAKPVAKIGDTPYTTLEDAFKAATEGCTIEILSDVTIDYKWDSRYTGGKFTVPVTINGNGNTLKFTGVVNDGFNQYSVFRFESAATVNNLTIDMSEAQSEFSGRFRAISAQANLTVNNCTFIGNGSANNTRAIIFGEGVGADLTNVEISITNSKFIGWRRAITDNENGKDVKTVVVTGNTVEDAYVYVSAYDSVTFSGNTVEGGYVDIRSYTTDAKLNVTAKENTLAENTETQYNYVKASGTLNVQKEFVLPPYGTLTNCYTSDSGYWGECGGNAKESFVFRFFNGDTYMGYTSLNNIDGIIDGDVNVSYHIKLDAASNTDEYWTMAWEVQPTLAMQPNRCEQWVDGVKVAECVVEPNWSDKIFPVVAAVTDAKGTILSYVNNTGSATIANAVANGGYVTLLADVKIGASVDLPADKTLTLDLNGKKISGSAVLNNAGDLTIRDSSAEKDATNELAIVNTGKLVISSGHFAGAISGDGEFAFTGGTYTQDVAAWCAEGYSSVEQPQLEGDESSEILWKVGKLPSATVLNLGPTTVTSADFGSSYWEFDLVTGTKDGNKKDPFDLQVVLNFIAKDSPEQAAQSAYANYATDFRIKIEGVSSDSIIADEDCYLAGYYAGMWVKVALTNFKIEDGVSYPVISALFPFTYEMICSGVKDFICGIHLSDKVLEENPDLKVSLDLGMTKTVEEMITGGNFIQVGETFDYTADEMRRPVAITGPDYYTSVSDAVTAALETGDFIKLVADAGLAEDLAVGGDFVFNLGGNTLSADGKTLAITDSVVTITNGTLSAFTKDNVTLAGNSILTVTDKNVADSFRTSDAHYVSQNANGTYSIMLKSAFRLFIAVVGNEPCLGFFKDGDKNFVLKGATNLENPVWTSVEYSQVTDVTSDSKLPLYWVKPIESGFRFFKLSAE